MSKKKNTQVTNNPKLITADQFRKQEQQKQNSNLMTAEDFTRRQQANAAMTGGINGVYNSLRNADNLQKAQAVNRVAAGAAIGTGREAAGISGIPHKCHRGQRMLHGAA